MPQVLKNSQAVWPLGMDQRPGAISTDPRIIRLQTIPGVGPRTAEILVACIDDPHRFKNGRQLSAYFGLVPKQHQSGETDRNGRITKRGNPLARTILVECAWASLRYNPWAKGVYERICGKQKTRKKKAGIALARKIAVIAWAMLRDGQDWNPNAMIRTTKSFGGKLPMDEAALEAMPKKEDRHKRRSRLAKEAKAAQLQESAAGKVIRKKTTKITVTTTRPSARKTHTQTNKHQSKTTITNKRPEAAEPRRTRKLVPAD
jgi:transposase